MSLDDSHYDLDDLRADSVIIDEVSVVANLETIELVFHVRDAPNSVVTLTLDGASELGRLLVDIVARERGAAR